MSATEPTPDPEIAALQAALDRITDDVVTIATRLAEAHALTIADALKAVQISFNILLSMPPSPFDVGSNMVPFPTTQQETSL